MQIIKINTSNITVDMAQTVVGYADLIACSNGHIGDIRFVSLSADGINVKADNPDWQRYLSDSWLRDALIYALETECPDADSVEVEGMYRECVA